MSTRKIIVVGGSAAGAKAAARARRLDQKAEITIIQKDPDLSMASCGYPYYIGGTFSERKMLLVTPTGVVRDPQFFQKTKRIKAMTGTLCTAIDKENKRVICRPVEGGGEFALDYDKLILCPGAKPAPLPIPGRDLAGVSTLLTMADTDFLHQQCAGGEVRQAVVVGGGLIGVEACEALVSRGIAVTMVELQDQILTFLDRQLAMLTANHMKSKGVVVRTGEKLAAFLGENGRLTGVRLASGEVLPATLAIAAAGVRPNADLAEAAGLAVGELGGIAVDAAMRTSDPDIYAAGDCVECTNMVSGRKVLAPMGDLANLQGRVAGENAVLGDTATFAGTIQTAICKVFDFAAGATGVSEHQARRLGMDTIETVVIAGPDKPGFMGTKPLVSKMVVEKGSKRIIGYQSVGGGDVSRQLATAAMAVRGGLTVDDLCSADLPYAPPFSLAIDHFITAAHVMQNKLAGRLKGVSAEEVWARVQAGNPPFLLDARGPDEFEVMRLGIGERYLPLGVLRERLGELPEDKSAEIVCYCKVALRGYEAALILEAAGYTNVKVMEGGILAWPYPREA